MLRLLAILLLCISGARACLWDRDTLEEEAKGKLDTVNAIVGWFDRYPPHYYQMRLDRVTKELAVDPQLLDLYDDAAVASSRLGQHTKAIAWMTLKKAILDTLPQDSTTAEARYRYLSNTGTFHLIRWIGMPQAERNADLADLRTSEDFIARALEINPDAHFGREKFQLMLIRWLLNPDPVADDYHDANFLNLETSIRMHLGVDQMPKEFTLEQARLGITGLVQLGAAWESVDVFQTLQVCLSAEKNGTLARLARLRVQELLAEGATSLHPSKEVDGQYREPFNFKDTVAGEKQIDRFYLHARAAAKQREAKWIAYQEERFAKGMHPDTQPDFWSSWQEPPFPELPLRQWMERNPGFSLLLILAGPALGLWILAKGSKLLAKRSSSGPQMAS
ncbi:hypothetical protein [Haloferula sp. BvORR071]|uniref:hypothetical protein n=1 Tax=Haloferula sp. BvORR071 TaxID=1396141 RepID=UPI0005524E2C|nr:hypothetical protein [Haloferula sp. BvORR071]